MRVALAALLVALVTSSARSDEALDTRLKALENELRCLVCQNQTLADSNAPLAEDLRKEVRDLATGGKSDAEIRDFSSRATAISCFTGRRSSRQRTCCGSDLSCCWRAASP